MGKPIEHEETSKEEVKIIEEQDYNIVDISLEQEELEVAFPLSDYSFDERENTFYSNGCCITGDLAKESYELLLKLKENILNNMFKNFVYDLEENLDDDISFIIKDKECSVFISEKVIITFNRDYFVKSCYNEEQDIFEEVLNSIKTKNI